MAEYVPPQVAGALREARARLGLTQAAVAKRVGVAASSVGNHERGWRGFDLDVARAYARLYNLDLNFLLTGDGPRREIHAERISLQGIIRMFGVVASVDTSKMQDFEPALVAPPGEESGDFVAYLIGNDFNMPGLHQGDVLYTKQPGPPEACLGKRCVAYLADGTRRVCILTRAASAGMFMLIGLVGAPVPEAEVIEAAPLAWIKYGE